MVLLLLLFCERNVYLRAQHLCSHNTHTHTHTHLPAHTLPHTRTHAPHTDGSVYAASLTLRALCICVQINYYAHALVVIVIVDHHHHHQDDRRHNSQQQDRRKDYTLTTAETDALRRLARDCQHKYSDAENIEVRVVAIARRLVTVSVCFVPLHVHISERSRARLSLIVYL